jgi:hypothetical protein
MNYNDKDKQMSIREVLKNDSHYPRDRHHRPCICGDHGIIRQEGRSWNGQDAGDL